MYFGLRLHLVAGVAGEGSKRDSFCEPRMFDLMRKGSNHLRTALAAQLAEPDSYERKSKFYVSDDETLMTLSHHCLAQHRISVHLVKQASGLKQLHRFPRTAPLSTRSATMSSATTFYDFSPKDSKSSFCELQIYSVTRI